MNLLYIVLFCAAFLLTTVWTHPVWDVSQILGNVSETEISDFEGEPDLNDPENSKAILGIIDSVKAGHMRIKCATAQGQEGRCTLGRCAKLGQGQKSVNCPGILAPFLTCCPNELATETMPSKVQGK